MGFAPPVRRGFFPLDEELGLLPGSLTPSLAEDIALLGSRLPFGQAAEIISHFRKIDVSEATVRRTTEKSGQAYLDLQMEDVEALEAEPREAAEGPALQQLSVDGAMVPLVGGEWSEVKTLAIGAIEEPRLEGEARAREMTYFSRMTDHQSFARLATVEIHRRGTERAGRVCAVMDGAEWQQKFIDLHRPDAVRILDWCHGAEYLAKAGQAAFGSGTPEASEWLGIQLHQLKHGEPQRLLGNLRELYRELSEGRERDSGALQAVKASLEYLEKRREQIRYAEFQAQGYPIGSGAVESANKLVVEQRLKGSGMHWARENVNRMVALRTVVCSDRWQEVWPRISRRLREQSRMGLGRHRPEKDLGRLSVQRRVPKVECANTPCQAPVGSTEKPASPPSQLRPRVQAKTKPAKANRVPHDGHRRPPPDHPWRRMTVGRTHSPNPLPIPNAKT